METKHSVRAVATISDARSIPALAEISSACQGNLMHALIFSAPPFLTSPATASCRPTPCFSPGTKQPHVRVTCRQEQSPDVFGRDVSLAQRCIITFSTTIISSLWDLSK